MGSGSCAYIIALIQLSVALSGRRQRGRSMVKRSGTGSTSSSGNHLKDEPSTRTTGVRSFTSPGVHWDGTLNIPSVEGGTLVLMGPAYSPSYSLIVGYSYYERPFQK